MIIKNQKGKHVNYPLGEIAEKCDLFCILQIALVLKYPLE